MDLKPTAEQELILDLFKQGGDLTVEAGAGVGKTTSLAMLAETTKKRGLYCAFNKAIVEDSKAKMPRNVSCSTAHSLAFRQIQPPRQRLNAPRMRSADIAKILGVRRLSVSPTQMASDRVELSAGYLASVVMRAVGWFCTTADPEPSVRHFPYLEGIDMPDDQGNRTYTNNNELARALLPHLRKAWADIINPHGVLPFKHDHYLKMWQLTDPVIGADFILFDEVQDANPLILDVVQKQAGKTQLVFVGDSSQQIYSFTGAINAMDSLGGNRAFLTQSFRFGQSIAEVANDLLDRLEAPLRLSGLASITSVVGSLQGPDVVLTRTNAGCVEVLIDALARERKVHVVGGVSDFISFTESAANLMRRQRATHSDLVCFSSWGQVDEYVRKDMQGHELKLRFDLIEKFGTERILSSLAETVAERAADLVISTAHRGKGREWRSVQVYPDFFLPGEDKDLPPDELRLMYVTSTRAKNHLDLDRVPHFLERPKALQRPNEPASVPA